MLFHPTYFPPIAQYVELIKSKQFTFEIEDNFQKQTYRNRCYIYSANGKQSLNVPIQHIKGIKQKTKEVKIDYKESWNKLHLKALQSAYSSSPFFEFYIDDLLPILEKKYEYLIDLNIASHLFIMEALQIEIPYNFSKEYLLSKVKNDFRNLAIAKNKTKFNFERYIQVFETSHGFIPNLSMLDLIFMEGPNTLNYLEQQSLKIN